MGFLVIGASIGLACVGKYLYDKLWPTRLPDQEDILIEIDQIVLILRDLYPDYEFATSASPNFLQQPIITSGLTFDYYCSDLSIAIDKDIKRDSALAMQIKKGLCLKHGIRYVIIPENVSDIENYLKIKLGRTIL